MVPVSMNEVINVNTSANNQPYGSFGKCRTRVAGTKQEDVEAFIEAINVYKECMSVSDDNAIKGIPILLDGNAVSGSRKLAPHKVFKELFSKIHNEKEPTDIFVSQCRALLSQIPPTPALHISHQIEG